MKNTLGTVLSIDIQNKLKILREQATSDLIEPESLPKPSSQSKSTRPSGDKSKQEHDQKNTSRPKPRFNKQDLQDYFERLNKGQDWLESTWPQLFNRETPKPLKRHIERDILPHVPEDLSKLQIRQSIYAYVKRRAYLESILNDTSRYDLSGTAVETISEQQKEFTREALRIKQENAEERQRRYEARKEYFAAKKRTQQVVPEQEPVAESDNSSEN